jgi:hypothetical protein
MPMEDRVQLDIRHPESGVNTDVTSWVSFIFRPTFREQRSLPPSKWHKESWPSRTNDPESKSKELEEDELGMAYG